MFAGEDGPDEGGAGMTAAVQIADHGIDVVGHAVLLGDQVTRSATSLPWTSAMTPSFMRDWLERR